MGNKILIIDDDRDSSDSLKSFLERKGYTIYVENNTIAGNEKFEGKKPDLLILDISLNSKPVGLHFLSNLKSKPSNKTFPVIVLTSLKLAMGMNLEDALSDERYYPNVAYLTKPADNEIILSEITGLFSKTFNVL